MLPPGCEPLLRTDPRKIDGYRIVGRLGAGGMATVYLAEADGYVALKLVHEHLAADAEFRARFERETELAARVPAHCSAALLGTGAYDDRPYLVSEYLAGSPLHRLVESEGPLDPGSLHNVAVGMAAGLTTIHDHGLIHRDIKPSNVIVTRGGVRIIDFGIARTLDTTTNFTQSGFVMGSLGWTSPEQLEGRSPTPAMDVFAWGCVLAYAATGRHPFGGDDSVSRSWRILNGEPDLDGVPGAVEDLVRAALDRDTDSRPTAQELLLGLVGAAAPVMRVRAAAPAAAGPVASMAESTGRPRRRWWALLLGALPVGVAAAVALSPSSGTGVMVERPGWTNPSSPGGPASGGTGTRQPTDQPGSGRTPALAPGGDGGAAGTGSQGATVGPPASNGPTTTAPTGNEQGNGNGNGQGNGQGNGNGNGNGQGNGNKPSKSPKG